MDVYLLVLRIVHILAGVFWVGSILLFFLFIQPTAKAVGPQAGPFMGHLNQQRKLGTALGLAGLVNIVAGILLYWRDSAGLNLAWITSATGLAFTVGGLFAIVALAIGFTVIRPSVDRLEALGAELQASGGPPSESQAAELGRLDTRLRVAGLTMVVLLTTTVLAMATARYL